MNIYICIFIYIYRSERGYRICLGFLKHVERESLVVELQCRVALCLHFLLLYVTWLIHMFTCNIPHSCDMTHPCVTWLSHTWRNSFVRDMTHWLIVVVELSLPCHAVLLISERCFAYVGVHWQVQSNVYTRKETYKRDLFSLPRHAVFLLPPATNESCHIRRSRFTYEWVISHVWQ